MWTQCIDKIRKACHQLSQSLGEHDILAPVSYQQQKLANASITLDLPSIRYLLPYESIDESLFFINKNTMGFGHFVTPLAEANESLVKSMSELLKNKLTVDVDCTVLLYRHHYIEQAIQNGFEPMQKAGGVYAVLAQLSMEYHLNAAKQGYPNGRNIAAKLSDYVVYLFFSKRNKPGDQETLAHLRTDIESELTVAGFSHQRLNARHFLTLMRSLMAPDLNQTTWPQIDYPPDASLSDSIPQGNSLIHVQDLFIDIEGSNASGEPFKTRLINCHIEKWPKEMMLWQIPDIYANLLEPQHGIPCSFLISMTIRGVNQTHMLAQAKTRAKSLNANSNAIQTFLNPSIVDESADWNFIYEEGSRDNLALLPVFYNVVLFCDAQKEREVLAKTISSYRQLGFELQQSRAMQWVRFLASLPFFMSEGFYKDFKSLGLIKTLTHFNAANLLPMIASNKGSPRGLLLPTYRHQMAFLDTFDHQHLPITNFNFLTIGSSGAGKSMFQQAQILSGIAMGEITYVIDLGQSYKHLCELVGGTYIDVSNITLNPFTLFDFDGKTQMATQDGQLNEVADNIQIRDLLAIMASPHTPICDIQKSYLLEAARHCWQKNARASCMDDVLEALHTRFNECADPRLNDLIILLSQYARDGIYGHLFNGDTPFLQTSNFVVFEMGGFQNNPDLLTIVMFVMIVIIQGQFYHTDRRVKKRCIIDEAWRFLTEGSNPIAAQFIEQGFRTARKHNGGFGVITQYLLDTEKTIQGQAIAASSDLKIIMRQGNFKEYVNAYPNRFNAHQQKMIASFGDVVGSGFSNLMIETGNVCSYHRYFADPFTRILFSSNGEEFTDIERLVAEGMSLMDAVRHIAKTRYGEA